MKPLYIISNIIYQIIICWVLIILNAYYNDLLIPESMVHTSGKTGMKILIALVEAVTFLSIVYVINGAALGDASGKESQKGVANKTGKVQLVITVFFIVVVILS